MATKEFSGDFAVGNYIASIDCPVEVKVNNMGKNQISLSWMNKGETNFRFEAVTKDGKKSAKIEAQVKGPSSARIVVSLASMSQSGLIAQGNLFAIGSSRESSGHLIGTATVNGQTRTLHKDYSMQGIKTVSVRAQSGPMVV